MKSAWHGCFAVALLVTIVGCSSQTATPTVKPVEKSQASTATQQPLVTGKSVNSVTPASEIVTLFLESLKKGDAVQTGNLLTAAAKEEIERRGLAIAPLGSPESTFRIGRTQYSDNDQDAAYVESEWIEPSDGGQAVGWDVVFTVHLEEQSWKISGMAIDMGEDQPPAIVDFENMAGMVPEKSTQPAQQQPAAQIALPPANNSTITR